MCPSSNYKVFVTSMKFLSLLHQYACPIRTFFTVTCRDSFWARVIFGFSFIFSVECITTFNAMKSRQYGYSI